MHQKNDMERLLPPTAMLTFGRLPEHKHCDRERTMNSMMSFSQEQVSTMLGTYKHFIFTDHTHPLFRKGFKVLTRTLRRSKIFDVVKYPFHFFVHFLRSIFATRSTEDIITLDVIVRATHTTKDQPKNSLTHP